MTRAEFLQLCVDNTHGDHTIITANTMAEFEEKAAAAYKARRAFTRECPTEELAKQMQWNSMELGLGKKYKKYLKPGEFPYALVLVGPFAGSLYKGLSEEKQYSLFSGLWALLKEDFPNGN